MSGDGSLETNKDVWLKLFSEYLKTRSFKEQDIRTYVSKLRSIFRLDHRNSLLVQLKNTYGDASVAQYKTVFKSWQKCAEKNDIKCPYFLSEESRTANSTFESKSHKPLELPVGVLEIVKRFARSYTDGVSTLALATWADVQCSMPFFGFNNIQDGILRCSFYVYQRFPSGNGLVFPLSKQELNHLISWAGVDTYSLNNPLIPTTKSGIVHASLHELLDAIPLIESDHSGSSVELKAIKEKEIFTPVLESNKKVLQELPVVNGDADLNRKNLDSGSDLKQSFVISTNPAVLAAIHTVQDKKIGIQSSTVDNFSVTSNKLLSAIESKKDLDIPSADNSIRSDAIVVPKEASIFIEKRIAVEDKNKIDSMDLNSVFDTILID